MPRILVLSEGPSEGNADRAAPQALITLLQRRWDEKHPSKPRPEFSFELFRDYPRARLHQFGPGAFKKKALSAAIQAGDEGWDGLVIVIDRDGDDDRDKQFREAHTEPTVTLPRALGIIHQMFEAWVIADEVAISSVFEETYQAQPAPEEISNPKKHFNDLVGGRSLGAATYQQIFGQVRINHVIARCPKGAGIFFGRLDDMFGHFSRIQ